MPPQADDAITSWPQPWRPLDKRGRTDFTSELRAELSAGHPLYGAPVDVVARCEACDDVIVVANDRWLVVHLTWRHAEQPPHPWIAFEARTPSELLQYTAQDGHDPDHTGPS